MRPLRRPPNIHVYASYKSYAPDLRRAFGTYCAYCEKAGGDLDVEHVEPKSIHPAKETDWSNLLLACPTCNRDYKKSWNDDPADGRMGYIFPDTDNSFSAFQYEETGIIKGLSPEAIHTIELCGLGRSAANSDRADEFWRARRAEKNLRSGRLSAQDVIDGYSKGHWSVWMTVFAGVPEMVALLCDPANFPGTRYP